MTNPKLLVLLRASRGALFPIPIITIFWMEQLGMSMTEVMTLQAIFAAAVITLEFPSGYIADRIGYRAALLIAATFGFIGWGIYSAATSFAGAVLAEIVLGVSIAFASGSDSALMYVSLRAHGEQAAYPRYEGRMRASMQTSEAVSSIIGGFLYSVAVRFPFFVQVANAVVEWLIAWRLVDREGEPPAVASSPEQRDAPRGLRSHLARARATVHTALVASPALRTAILLHVVLALGSFFAVWLYQPYLAERGIDAKWFGAIWAVANLVVAGAGLLSERLAKLLSVRGVLLLCCFLLAAGHALMGLIALPFAFVFYFLITASRGLQSPLLFSVMQEHSPEDRASVLSLSSLLFRGSFMILGPPLGLLVDRIGLDASLLVLAVALPAVGIVAWLAFSAAHRT